MVKFKKKTFSMPADKSLAKGFLCIVSVMNSVVDLTLFAKV